jgi:RNA polymerase sigma factor (sigma-70 family)
MGSTTENKSQYLKKLGFGPSHQRRPWYVSDRRIRTEKAAREARGIAQRIRAGEDLGDDDDETRLFLAMQACAFRAFRRQSADVTKREDRCPWIKRWQCIREHIVAKNLGLAYSTMNRFRFRDVDNDDVLSEALFGLTRAVDRFNPFKGYRFSTYACNVITRSLVRRLRQAKRYHQFFPVQHDVSFERPEGMPDTNTELLIERLNRAIGKNLGGLTHLETLVIEKRFPHDRRPRTTFADIGRSIGLSKERVRQIQNAALAKLRRFLNEDPVLERV